MKKRPVNKSELRRRRREEGRRRRRWVAVRIRLAGKISASLHL